MDSCRTISSLASPTNSPNRKLTYSPSSSTTRKIFSHPATLLLLLLLCLDLSVIQTEAFARTKTGLLKLCPPGGESFAAAWEIACGMRRKKRDTSAETPTNATDSPPAAQKESLPTNSTDSDLAAAKDKSATDKVVAEVEAGAALANPEPLLGGSPAVSESLRRKKRSSLLEPSKIFNGEKDGGVEKKDFVIVEKEGGDGEENYRVPTMTEMMMLCCRYGCSLRDLLPYCDPFGQWDS